MNKLGIYFFKNRSYIPLPFFFLMLLFINPTTDSMLIGFFITLFGETIRIWAVSYAGSETRTTSGVGGTFLVTQGPYGIIRNPLYAGNILIYTGLGIMSNSLFPYLQIAGLLFFTFQYYCIIISEEEYLKTTFKDSFEVYTRKVKRFLPFPSKLPDEVRSNLELKIKVGLISEKRSLQAIFITLILILFFYLTGIRIF